MQEVFIKCTLVKTPRSHKNLINCAISKTVYEIKYILLNDMGIKYYLLVRINFVLVRELVLNPMCNEYYAKKEKLNA